MCVQRGMGKDLSADYADYAERNHPKKRGDFNAPLGFLVTAQSVFSVLNQCYLRNLRMIYQAPVAELLAAISPFSFMISSVISAEAYISFTSSHSLTV